MNSKYYKVTCKCGHVGRNKFIPISFPIMAQNGKDAAKLARYIPRVKHDRKDAILECKEITYEEYLQLKKINKKDPYLKCKNVQEQNLIENLKNRLQDETYFKKWKKKRAPAQYRLKKQMYAEDNKWLDYDKEEYGYELFAY